MPIPARADYEALFPHHYHAGPDIKHNRLPARGLGFDAPNLPRLIADCIELGKTLAP